MTLALDATSPTRDPPHGFQRLSTCITHNTQTTADSRLDATRIPAHGAAAEAKRTPAHDAAAVQHGGPCYAGTSATRTTERYPHNTAVQCEWCTAWHAALLCSFRTLALTTATARSGTQLDPWPVGAAPDT